MGTCNIDHSLADVRKKLSDQSEFLPEHITKQCRILLTNEPDQLLLNELFHLLKKYDLASETEKQKRNEQIVQLTNA
ncbi:hypothetical protein ACLIBH_01895 [Virgibacillus sp. W0430]|uniref:hypothetical protein n=1 Tax=Virgibacillus sp. W0430 TaxID=3391580 RepID=UPI003F448B2D